MPANLRTFDEFVGETEFALRMLRLYLNASEEGLQAARLAEKARLDAEAREIEGEFIAVVGVFIDHAVAHHEELPRLMRYSHIVAIHSLLERQLALLCQELVRRRKNLALLPEDLRGYPNTGAYKIFLTKVVDAEISVWKRLNTLRLARNCIAHADGFVDGLDRSADRKALRRAIRNTEGISESPEGRLQIDAVFVDSAFDAVSTLFEEAFGNLGFGQGWPPSKFPENCALVADAESRTIRVISDDGEFEELLESEG